MTDIGKFLSDVEKVKKLGCFIGVKTLTAMTIVVETGDFFRFRTAKDYAGFLGLVPGEHSSADSSTHMGITKAGNGHLRKALIESADSICKGIIGYKSKDLKRRQRGNRTDVIAYADKGNEKRRNAATLRHEPDPRSFVLFFVFLNRSLSRDQAMPPAAEAWMRSMRA